MKYYKYNETELKFEETRKPIQLNVLLGIICVIMLFSGFVIQNEVQSYNLEEKLIIIKNEKDKFSEEKFVKSLIDLNVKFPDVVYAQAVLETGRFSSTVFLENNNLFGMKEAKMRPTTAIGTENSHAYYTNWKQSVIDYALYQSKYLSRLTRDEYLQYLNKNYAEIDNYVDRLKSIIDSNKSLFK